MSIRDRLRDNLLRVHERIAAACSRANRPTNDVRLVAVTKYVDPDVIRALVELGCDRLGENRVQRIIDRASGLTDVIGGDWSDGEVAVNAEIHHANWHMIGHLQRNKVRQLLPHVRVLHSLDSTRLADEIQRQSVLLDVHCDAFVEVNVAGEASKEGLAPSELDAMIKHIAKCDRIRLRGLMTMAPISSHQDDARRHFARLRVLLESLRERGLLPMTCVHLSMGMSGDFEAAITEGATFVRIGSSLFDGIPLKTNTPT